MHISPPRKDPKDKTPDEKSLERLQVLTNICRIYLQDFEENNHLIGKEEFTDEQILTFLLMAMDHYNNRVTPISIKAEVLTFPSLTLWLDGAAIFALKSAIFKFQRNSFQYSDGGTQVVTDEKAPEYERTLQRLMAEWTQDARLVKESINLEGCYGGISSEYLTLYTSGYHGLRSRSAM